MQLLAWTLVAVAVLVIALGATATLVLIRANSNEIPVVSDIGTELESDSVRFSWDDPGLADDDAYQISVDGGSVSVQTQPAFVVNTDPGDHTCITVRVSRDGRLGDASNPKCVDVPE